MFPNNTRHTLRSRTVATADVQHSNFCWTVKYNRCVEAITKAGSIVSRVHVATLVTAKNDVPFTLHNSSVGNANTENSNLPRRRPVTMRGHPTGSESLAPNFCNLILIYHT